MISDHRFRRNSSPEVRSESVNVVERFLQDTSLHGLKYTAQKQSNKAEKAFWALAFLAGLSLSVYFVIQIYKSWDEKPIITTVETRNEPIENVDFPAVTVCPGHQVLNKKFDTLLNITEFYNDKEANLKLSRRLLIGALSLGLSLDESQPLPESYTGLLLERTVAYFAKNTSGFTNAMLNVKPNCDDIVYSCSWKSEPGCQVKMRTLLTPMGSCCTFNFPYRDSESPLRTAYKGKGFGLQLLLLSRNNDTTTQTYSHDVLVHDYKTYPYRPTLTIHVGPGELLDVAVEPESVNSETDVKSVSEVKRDCKFEEEYQLGPKLPATYNNCIMNCFSKFQTEMCGCIQAYMAQFFPNVTVCGLAEIACVKQALQNVTGNLVQLCQCRPPCNEVIYNTEIAVRPATFFDTMLPTRFYESDLRNFSVVNVFFKRSRFIKYTSSLRYEWQDFIAAAGGLLGVGFGFSLLSAVEVLYFFGYKCWKNGARASSATLTDREEFVIPLPPRAHLRHYYQHKVRYETSTQRPFTPY